MADKPDQADIVAQLASINTALAGAKLTFPDLISQHASLTAEKTTLTSQIAALTGDKTKLVAGATLPTDLVTGANSIAQLSAENAQLKADKSTLVADVAKEVAKLGFVGGKKEEGKTEAGKEMTLTEKVCAAKGAKSLDELNTQYEANLAKNPGV